MFRLRSATLKFQIQMEFTGKIPLYLREKRKCWMFLKIGRRAIRLCPLTMIFFMVIAVIGFIINVRFIIMFMKNNAHQDAVEKIDWHDWKLIEADKLRTGLGEHGQGDSLSWYPESSKVINDTHGYNGYLSDKIALDRSLIDLRPRG